MTGNAWDAREVDLAIDTYFTMLSLELDGEAYSKATFRRDLRSRIDRSDGSVEYKLQNISAVLAELGGVFIDGYKPARNAQRLLRDRVTERFREASQLRQQMIRIADEPFEGAGRELGEAGEPPEVTLVPPAAGRTRTGRVVDFQEREGRNRTLGLAGEEAVVRLERRRLAALGQNDLADRVRHVSLLDGDGLGYDVLSFLPDGTERYIEVKTTRHSRELPFFVSQNEVDFSADEPDRFSLYRLYRFDSGAAGHYELRGSLHKTAQLIPDSYRGLPRAE